jgi:prevent-host-death family protein
MRQHEEAPSPTRTFVANTDHKGAVAELAVATAAAKIGVGVLKPLVDHARYDLLFDIGGRFLRVQCKSARKDGATLVIRLNTHRLTTQGPVSTTYSHDEIDAVAAYCAALDRCYLLPIDLVAGRHAISLRLRPPRNSQRAWIHWASDFDLPGAIAQLGERPAGSRKVGGSNPPSSTAAVPSRPGTDSVSEIGAHAFRERLGWYMQRVGAGERFVITRRGKPFARLEPVRPFDLEPGPNGARLSSMARRLEATANGRPGPNVRARR